jgi:hypothetical protein
MAIRCSRSRAILATVAIAAAGLLSPAAASAVSGPADLPDAAAARVLLADTIFAPVREAAAARARSVREPDTGDRVWFRPEVQGGSLYLVFSSVRGGGISTATAGTYVIKRSMANGAFLQAKIFLRSDPGWFVRLFPAGERTLMDVYLMGEPLHRGVMVALPFDRLLTSPFSTIADLTRGVVDWSLLWPSERTTGDERLEAIVHAIRPRLSLLADVEDGAMDSAGRFVYIRDGSPQRGKGGFNCSGFAKYVIDGFYQHLSAGLTDIQSLKSRNMDVRKNPLGERYEDRDPYFGLDWSRNLARALQAARTGAESPPPEFADVTDSELFPYRPEIGFPIASLNLVLYMLWKRDPGRIYLGSVNVEAGDGAPVRQHHHIAVFFPYQDAEGGFRLVVMERNVETSTVLLQKRFPGEFVHLVAVDSEGDFTPPIRPGKVE